MLFIRLIFVAFFSLSFTAHGQLNIAYFLGAGRYELYKENYPEAITRFTAIINSRPQIVESWFLRGISKYNLGDYRGALEDFHQAVKLNPFYADAFHYRGITLMQLGDFENAKKDLTTALELNPANSRIYADLGIIHLMREEYRKALEYFNESLKIERTNPETYFNRAVCYIHLGDTVAAISNLNTGIRINPFSAEAFRRLGLIFYQQGKYKEALEQFSQALSLDEGNTMIMFQRAITYYQLKKLDLAIDELGRILELDKDNALVYYNRAIIYTEIGNYTEAINDYTNAMLINPDNILVYYNRAGVKIELKDYRGALNDYNRALEIFPDFATAYYNRSYVKGVLGDKRGAFLDRMKAEKLIAEHRKDTKDTSEFALLRDTTYNFQKLLDFNSEFSNSFTRKRLQNQPMQISRQGYYLLEISHVPPKEGLPFVEALFKFNQSKNNWLKLYPKLIVKYEASAESPDSIPISDPELSIINRILESANMLNYYEALQYLQKNRQNIKHQWLVYYLEGTIEAIMVEYVNSMVDITSKTKLTESGTVKGSSEIQTMVDLTRAEEALSKSIELNPDFSLVWYNRGNIQIQNQRFKEAIEDYTRALSIDENIPQAYFNRGLTLIFLQEIERGCLDISRAGQLGISEAYTVIKRFCEKKNLKK